MELPRMLHSVDGERLTVRTVAEYEAAMARGWRLSRVPPSETPAPDPVVPKRKKAR